MSLIRHTFYFDALQTRKDAEANSVNSCYIEVNQINLTEGRPLDNCFFQKQFLILIEWF